MYSGVPLTLSGPAEPRVTSEVVGAPAPSFAALTASPKQSNAKEPLVMCVLEAVNGLKLDPPDMSSAQATFSYELKPSGAAATM